jgi:hypothetical protein
MNEENPVSSWDQNQPTFGQWGLIAGIIVILFCGAAGFLFFAYRTYSQWAEGRNQQATQVAATATAEVQYHIDIVNTAREWPLAFFDSFYDNENEWQTGEIDDDYTTMMTSINGRYIWEAEAKQGFVWRIWPQSDTVSDFYISVEAQNTSKNHNAQYGLIFHNNDGSYNYLEIRDNQSFRVLNLYEQEWIELIPSTFSALIQPGEANHLEVVAQSGIFYILINGELVGQTSSSYPTEGQVGLAIGLSEVGETATIEFDNFEFRFPTSP